MMEPWLTGEEEHLASLPDESRWDGYDRGDLDYVEMPPWCEHGAEAFGMNLATVAGHIVWERKVAADDHAQAVARENYLAGLAGAEPIWF